MHVSVARPGELGPHEIAAWHAMQGQTDSLANPFLCPEFTVAVGQFRPEARVAVLADGPGIAGFFPFERRRFGAGVPIGAGLNDCQGVIHAPGVTWDSQELLRKCGLGVWQFDNLTEGQRAFERYIVTVAPSPVIDLTGGFARYRERLKARSPRFCSDMARKGRKLGREAGELDFAADSRDTAHLYTLLRWKSGQYRRTGLIDIFDRPWVVGLVEYLFSIQNDSFQGLLSVLHAGGNPVAAHFGLRSGHVLAQWFPAYDPRFGKCSPGLVHFMLMAEELAAAGIGTIDLGHAAGYKERLKSHDTFIAAGMAARGSLTAGAHRARRTVRSWAGRRAVRWPPLFHAADRLLRRYGRIG